MKMKSFAVLAFSGLIAASIANIAPAMADDMSNSNGQTMQTPPDDNVQNQNSPTTTPPTDSMNNNSNPGNNNNGNTGSTTDQGSPDTATGDDDY